METKTITIKDAAIADKQYLDAIAKTKGGTIALAFATIIEAAKNAENQPANNPENEKTIIDLNEKITLLKTEIDKMAAAYLEQSNQVAELLTDNENLKNKEPEVKEVEKLIEKPLTGSQFICQLDEQTALNARKIRKFAYQDGIVNTTEGFEYINQLVNVAVNKYVGFKYEHLIK